MRRSGCCGILLSLRIRRGPTIRRRHLRGFLRIADCDNFPGIFKSFMAPPPTASNRGRSGCFPAKAVTSRVPAASWCFCQRRPTSDSAWKIEHFAQTDAVFPLVRRFVYHHEQFLSHKIITSQECLVRRKIRSSNRKPRPFAPLS
jgi:hypothetical protein